MSKGHRLPDIKVEVKEAKRKIIKYSSEKFGLIEATIWDGVLTDFRACESGSEPTICNSNPQFLRAVRDALSNLLYELDGAD